MWKGILTSGFVLGVIIPCLTAETIKVVSLYGIYTQKDDVYKQILNDASTYINDGRSIPPILPTGVQVNVIHDKTLEGRAFEEQTLSKSVYRICNNIRNSEAAAVILPNDFCPDCEKVGSVLGDAYSPVITLDQADNSGAFKMRPSLKELEELYTDVITNFRWRTFIFLYQGDIAFRLVESMMSHAVERGWIVTPVKYDEKNFEKQTKMLKKKTVKNILVYFQDEDLLQSLIDVSFETQLLTNGWHWIFGNLNPPISKLWLEEKYRHNMAFLTRFKVLSNELIYYTSISVPIKLWQFRQRAAYDALVAIGMAMNLHYIERGTYPGAIRLCGSNEKSQLEPFLKKVNFRGASGDVSFNDKGERVNYTINIFSGKDKHAHNQVGYFVQDIRSWEIVNKQKWPGKPGKRTYLQPYRQSDVRFIKILAVPEPPFFMEKGWEPLRYKTERFTKEEIATINDEPYEGYVWELLKQIKIVFETEMDLDFNFQIVMMSRGQYGTLDLATGEWDGMIRELIDGDADIGIGALTKIGKREKDIDFTTEFYISQLKLVILHPSWTFEYPFSMVYPFHFTAWAGVLVAFLFISFITMLLGYFGPYEWRNLAERGEASEEEAQTFNVLNSLFYILSAGFWQGYSKKPRSSSLRLLSGCWFFFSVSMVFLFVNNLNGVLKFSKTAINLKDVHDLLYNDVLDFGCVRNSPSFDFYRYGKGNHRMVFDRILNSEKNLIEERIEQAVYRIRRQWNGRYAILGEERILKYAADRWPCRLFITGKSFGKILFSFATPSGSPLRDQLSYAIELLKKRGNISRILEMEFSDRLPCSAETVWETETRKSLTVHDLQGLYYMVFIGMCGSLVVFIIEWLVYLLIVDKGWENRGTTRSSIGLQLKPGEEIQSQMYDSGPRGGGGDVPTDWI